MRPIILILGPTAGGKTTLSISIAEQLGGGGECVIADSMQVYRGMDIGTAKPTNQEREKIEHHLVDIFGPDEDGFTVETWLSNAENAIKKINRQEKWPIIVGGTNLYIQAFLYGLFKGPKSDPKIRAELNTLKNNELHSKLRNVDPDSASKIHINDKKRIIRALEVFEITGIPISVQQEQWEREPRKNVIIIGLDWPVEMINQRINSRVKEMVKLGLLDEVKKLRQNLNNQSREALGYKQFLSFLNGEISEKEAIEQIKVLTRRYAKQQRTWLKRFRVLPNALFIDMKNKNMQTAAKEALKYISGRVLDIK